MMWTSPNEICYYVGEVILVSTKTACDNKGKNIIQVLSYDSGSDWKSFQKLEISKNMSK